MNNKNNTSRITFKTNQTALEPEFLEVVRLFSTFSLQIYYHLQINSNKVVSDITVNEHQYRQEKEIEEGDPIEQKRLVKRFAKLALYEALSQETHKVLPWGALTGIRPTKLAYQYIEQGADFKQNFANLHVVPQNISLVEQILKIQKPYYQNQKAMQKADLYISIPFCPTRCNYCSFITAPISKTRQYLEKYLQILQLELQHIDGLYNSLSSIYIGGGTPLILDEEQLYSLLSNVKQFVTNGIEYTVEAGRPDVFTERKLEILKEFAVNRICVNPQSFSNQTLENIGRAHTEKDILIAMEMTKKYNFICNCDLIAGLTGESYESFCESVDKAIALTPENITVHTLSIKKGAELQVKNAMLEDDSIDKKIEAVQHMLNYARKQLLKAGYAPYYMYRQKNIMADGENIGWCKPNTACIYNIHMMEEIADTIACGANAISKVIFEKKNRIERYGTPKDIPTYLAKIDKIIEEKRALFGQKINNNLKN